MKLDNKIGNLLHSAGVPAACGTLILPVGITSLGAIMHRRLGDPSVWQEEAQPAPVIWVVFLRGRHAFVYGNYATIDVTVGIPPERFQKSLSVLTAAAAAIVLCYVGYQRVRYVMQVVRYDHVTDALKISYSLIYAPLPAGCPTMAVQACLNTYRDLTGKREEV